MSEHGIGEQREIDGVLMECVSLGTVTADRTLVIDEGTMILAEGPEALVEFLDDDCHAVAVWRPVVALSAERQMEATQMEIDSRIPLLRKQLLDCEEDGTLPLVVAAALMRAAYGGGYVDALREENPGEMAERLGFENPAKKRDA